MHGNVGVCTMYILYNSYIALIILFVHKKLIVNLVNDYVNVCKTCHENRNL